MCWPNKIVNIFNGDVVKKSIRWLYLVSLFLSLLFVFWIMVGRSEQGSIQDLIALVGVFIVGLIQVNTACIISIIEDNKSNK